MSAVIRELDAEIGEVEADIAKNPDPRLLRLRRLRLTRAMYLNEVTVDPVADPETISDELNAEVNEALGSLTRRSGRRPSRERRMALSAAHTFLLDKTEPVRLGPILSHLQSLNIEIGGTDPLNNLSAMLSNDERFESHGGRRGWMVKRQEAA